MRDIAALTFITLDGVMQAVRLPDEDRSGGFTSGGWAADYWDPVMEQVQREAMAEPYDMLLGRKTYALFSSHQDSSMNNGHVYVASSGLTDPKWQNVTVLSGDVASEVRKIKQQDGPLLQIHGSWQLIQALLTADLIDEFRLWVFPVTVGSGKRLFQSDFKGGPLKLLKTEPTGNGVVMNVYRKSG
ncbi:dihydrofolate reductase family protein [Parasphingorhabdus litoris]|uniref:Dihydrofolate reductase family protein n=1 Tax=Parasphingorhabdus litoris TaxID=394733 RepID=A0ABP3K6Z7_9SPHN|nr:dihydrofolate reductase family protein [Parasphingorhabdus litoris]